MKGKEILSMQGITKSYSGVKVLQDMDFLLHEGEIHCIVGENGAGKSTFIKTLSGAISPDSGTMEVFGRPYTRFTPQDAIDLGISTIYQDVDLVESLTVADNIFLGEELNSLGIVRKSEQEKASRELLDRLKIRMDPGVLVEALSPAQNQHLQLVKAMHRKARILIMDEPTASLGEEESEALTKMVRELADHGLGVIYISHYLEEVFDIADCITVLKDGKVTGCYAEGTYTHNEIIKAMVGRESSLFYERERIPIGETILTAEHMTNLPVVDDVSFDLRKGEILGIGGLVGSGRTELMNLIFGVDKKQSGTLTLNGKKTTIRSPHDAIKNRICMLGENRKQDGLFIDRSLLENICVVRNEEKAFISWKKDHHSTDEMIRKLNLKTRGHDMEVGFLSGGNQQKSIIARWMLTQSQIIIFDEPTKGVDIGAREEIYKLMVEFAKSGKSIIMVSSDMVEILSMSDRICIMREGRMEQIVETHNLTEEKLLQMYIGA